MCDFLSSDVGRFLQRSQKPVCWDKCVNIVGLSALWCAIVHEGPHVKVSTDLIKNANIVLQRREINILQKKGKAPISHSYTSECSVISSEGNQRSRSGASSSNIQHRLPTWGRSLHCKSYRTLNSCLVNLGLIIPDVCQFWYTTALFRPEK